MKQNVSETESNQRFQKNVKTCLQNKKVYLMPPSRWPFSSDFNSASQDDQVTAVTWKHCPLAVSPIFTSCKELHLKYGKIPRSASENFAMHEN